jgi:hypothetical protein
MTFERPQLRPCHWPTMGSTQPHHARPKLCMQGPTTLAIFEHILGLLHSKPLTPSGQSPAASEDRKTLPIFLGGYLSPSASCVERTENDVIGITGRHHQSNFQDMLRVIGTQSSFPLVAHHLGLFENPHTYTILNVTFLPA